MRLISVALLVLLAGCRGPRVTPKPSTPPIKDKIDFHAPGISDEECPDGSCAIK